MKKFKFPAYLALGATLVFASCNNANQNSDQQSAAHHQHDGHDHSGHDHSAHNHSTAHANTQTVTTAPPSATIPLFTFYKVKSGVSFTSQDIPKGKKTVFILFDPSCSHCRTEAAGLGKNYDKIKDLNIYFVSMNDPALQATFLETFAKELVGKPNIEVLYDKNQDFVQKFHVPTQFPANYVYSADGKLESHWDGDRNINQIIKDYTK